MKPANRAMLMAIATAVTILNPLPVLGQATGPDAVERQALDIRDRFVKAIEACGIEPAFGPGIVMKTHPGVVAYFKQDRSAHLSRWADLPLPVQGMVEAWAASGTAGLDGEAHFVQVFNGLLLPHELGHYLQHMSGRLDTLPRWESEIEANRIAIAFWSLEGTDSASLPERIENFSRFLESLPSPVPEGVDLRDHFNANYDTLGEDAAAYGWYQGTLMRRAWDERGQTDFCSLVRLNAPA